MFSIGIIITMLIWFAACITLPVMTWMGVDETLRSNYSYVLQIAASLFGALACYLTVFSFKSGDPLRKVWGFLGTGLLSWCIGSAIYTAYPFMHQGQETPYPWYSDFGYLGLVPLVVIALIIFKRSIHVPAPLWGLISAILVFFAALAVSVWGSLGNLDKANLLIEYAIEVAYIIFNPVLLSVTIYCASMLAGGLLARPWWFGFSGLLLYYLGDVGYALVVATDSYTSGHLIDTSWPLAFGLITLSGLMTQRMFKLLEE